jgi:uncharacterized protein YndB with AHSA1/START domain
VAAEYRFLTTWEVPAPPDEVYDAIGDVTSYPRWWGDVFVSVTGESGPPHPGKKADIVARGFLPYKLRWQLNTLEVDRPRRLKFAASGDFEGGGEWTFEPDGSGTKATFDWRPIVEKPGVKQLTPVLRPLFRKNHLWTMKRGREHIEEELELRRAASNEPAAHQ